MEQVMEAGVSRSVTAKKTRRRTGDNRLEGKADQTELA